MKQNILVTNDDGIESHFMREMVIALETAGHQVSVVAPAGEQSWIGRAISRGGTVKVNKKTGWAGDTWSCSGTPTDCVNIAIHHLLPQKPDWVISGMNLGYNVSLPLITGSGTVAGALEATFNGIPAIAVSMAVPNGEYDVIRKAKGRVQGAFGQSVKNAANWVPKFLDRHHDSHNEESLEIYNVNFPVWVDPQTNWVETIPEFRQLGKLYHQSNAGYEFRFPLQSMMKTFKGSESLATDTEVIKDGKISWGRIDFSKIGQPSLSN